MSAWPRSAVVLAVLAALAVPAAAPAHVGSSSLTVDDAAKRKRAKKKCKKRQVKVKVGRRVTCRPLKRAFPRPKKGDPRKLFTKFVYGKDWSAYRTRRGKRIPSLPKLIRKTGRGAPALLARATSRGLARLDAMEGAAAVRAAARAGPAATGCNAQAPRQSDRFTQGGAGGGPSASVGVTYGPDGASVGIELTGNDISVSADIDMGLCDPNEVEAPSCPTAVGKLEGLIRYKFKVAITVTRGGTNIWSQGMDVTRRTKLVGWNEVDAKLDQLDIEDTETSNFTLGGTTRGFPPISIRTRLERRTQVNMRSGSYEPGRSNVEVTINMDGLFGPDRDEAEAEAERKARTDGDQQFRAVVEKAISGYRTREEGWQRPTCADLKFAAAPNTITLRGGGSGTFTATAIAKADGQPSELDARLSEPQNAVFSPTRAGGQRAQFGYSNVVRPTSPGSKVRAKVRATSKAGVAEGTWEQPIQPPPPRPPSAYNGTFSGTGVYDSNELGDGNSLQANWNGSFHATSSGPSSPGASDARYTFQSGSLQYSFSGHVDDCDVEGSGPVDLTSQPDYQNLALIYLQFDSPTRKYQLQVPAPLFAMVPGTTSNCEDPMDNGDDFDWAPGAGVPWMAFAPLPGGPVGNNWSISGSGSGDTGPGSPDQTWQWTLTPIP